jgi:glycosyltransferase involved in cell wall biosynthesis
LTGYSKSCLRTDCGYTSGKKILHSFFNCMTKVQIRRCQFRFLSSYTKDLFESRYGPLKSIVQPNITMYDFTVSTRDKEMLSKHSLKRDAFLIFIGRESMDKGYDRFQDLKTNFIKVACGPDKSADSSIKNLGWVDESSVITLAKNAKAIIYPSRQPDCDPLVQQLSEHFDIPFIVSNNNAATEFALKKFGSAAIVDKWETVSIDDRIARTNAMNQPLHRRNISISQFYDQYF